MKAADVVIQLKTILPTFTDLFTQNISISSLSKSGDTITAVTSVEHGFANDDIVNIQGALTPFDVTNLTSDGNGIATAETLQVHDFTQGYPAVALMINANQAEYNGQIISNKRINYRQPLERSYAADRELLSVPNRKKITYAITGTPITPATGSNIRIIQNFKSGYNGLHQITVVDPTTFTYQETKNIGSPAEGDSIIAKGAARISSVINFDRLLKSYTKHPPTQAWAFVVINSHRASRDTYTLSDLTIENLPAFDYKQIIDQQFSIFIVLPSKADVGGGNLADFLSQEMNKYLIKSIVGIKFNSILSNDAQYLCSYEGNVPFLYTTAFMIHEYQFSQAYYLTVEDEADKDTSVAFRDLELKFNSDAGELMDTNVNLDDNPLP